MSASSYLVVYKINVTNIFQNLFYIIQRWDNSTHWTQVVSLGRIHIVCELYRGGKKALEIWSDMGCIKTRQKRDPCCDSGGCVQSSMTSQRKTLWPNAVAMWSAYAGCAEGTVREKRGDVRGYFSRWGSPVTQCTCSVKYMLDCGWNGRWEVSLARGDLFEVLSIFSPPHLTSYLFEDYNVQF